MPRRARPALRYDVQSLTEIMGELEVHLNDGHHDNDESEHDLWLECVLYNLAAKLVEVQSTQRVAVDLLQRVATEVRDIGDEKKRGRSRGKRTDSETIPS